MPAVSKLLVVKRKESDFGKVCSFFTEKTVTSCAGSVIQNIRNAARGLLDEGLYNQQGLRLLKLQIIGSVNVEVIPNIPL